MATDLSKTMEARESVMASIRHSLAASRPFDAEHQKHHTAPGIPWAPIVPSLSREELIENFRESLAFVAADCRVLNDKESAAKEIASIVDFHGSKRVAVSDSPIVAEVSAGIGGVELIRNAPAATLFSSDIGITSAQWAIAETGTLVLESERERHRLTSLVPPVHICILRAADIRQTLGEILDLVGGNLSPAITFITGASRTSDIELTLAIGVHGPKHLHVIVIDED